MLPPLDEAKAPRPRLEPLIDRLRPQSFLGVTAIPRPPPRPPRRSSEAIPTAPERYIVGAPLGVPAPNFSSRSFTIALCTWLTGPGTFAPSLHVSARFLPPVSMWIS